MNKSLLMGTLALATMAGTAWAAVPHTNTPSAKASPSGQAPAASSHRASPRAQVGQVWDWSKIDTNKDNLVEPAEMEAWLKANPPVQKGG